MMFWLRQPLIQWLIGIILVLAVLTGVYFYGKSAGRGQAQTEFDIQQADLLKKSQDSVLKADAAAAKALESEIYASKLKELLQVDRKIAAQSEAQMTAVYNESIKEIDKKYEDDRVFIFSDANSCDRCNDLCNRINALRKYGPEFAGYSCDASVDCRDACRP